MIVQYCYGKHSFNITITVCAQPEIETYCLRYIVLYTSEHIKLVVAEFQKFCYKKMLVEKLMYLSECATQPNSK